MAVKISDERETAALGVPADAVLRDDIAARLQKLVSELDRDEPKA